MAPWNDKGQIVCMSKVKNDQVRNVTYSLPPKKTSTGGKKVGDTCSGPEGIHLNKAPLKNTTTNENPSSSCVRACHKCHKQCPYQNRPSRPQKSSKPAVTPNRPETINGVELAEKMCDLTNAFLTNIGNILSTNIPRVEIAKGQINTPVTNDGSKNKILR
jgi:hypothetical protein